MAVSNSELLVYDIGMHNGDDTAYYLSLGYKVVSIDASPDLVEQALTRFESPISEGRLKILNVGVADQSGFLEFYQNMKNSVWNSFDKEIGSRDNADVKIIKIQTKAIDEIVREHGMPFYMKVDIEGNDITCINALIKYGQKPQFISVEVNGIDLILRLHQLGYTQFKLIEQFHFVPLQLPALKEYKAMKNHKWFKHSRNVFVRVVRRIFGSRIHPQWEMKYKHWLNYPHPSGSSGPFGSNLPGKWQTIEEVLEVYLYYKKEHAKKYGDDYNFWIDCHATS